jgi:hypothetical protein
MSSRESTRWLVRLVRLANEEIGQVADARRPGGTYNGP